MTFAALVARFPGTPRRVGPDEVKVRCPLLSHRDSDPSVSIKRSGDKILLYDHAGCSRGDILTAIGCTFSDLFLEGGHNGHAQQSA